MRPSLSDVQQYLDSIDLQMVRPSDLRNIFNLDDKEYQWLRTTLPRWARKGEINNPTKGYYRANPKVTDWNDLINRIPPENTRYHNFQLVGRFPKKRRGGGIGGFSNNSQFRQTTIQLSWGGDCKISYHRNGTFEIQTCNSKKPWEIIDVTRFFGWVEREIYPYEAWEIDLRIKQFDIHVDSKFFTLSGEYAIRIGHLDKVLYQIYKKRVLGATRIEIPAKVNLTPGQFIDLLMNIKGGYS